jgi:H/ACA ribonucleoprotein complex non-core subunit NAF1
MASFVFTRDLRKLKGSDASNVWDEEVAAAEMEWSDDEAELDYKRSQKAEYVLFHSFDSFSPY